MIFQFFCFGFVQFRFSRNIGVAHIDGSVGYLFQARTGTTGIKSNGNVLIASLKLFCRILYEWQQCRRTGTGNTAGNSSLLTGSSLILVTRTTAPGSSYNHHSS